MWTTNERLAVISELRRLTAIYPRKLDDTAMSAYCDALSRFTPDAIKAGVDEMVGERERGTYPTPGEIASHARHHVKHPPAIPEHVAAVDAETERINKLMRKFLVFVVEDGPFDEKDLAARAINHLLENKVSPNRGIIRAYQERIEALS